MIRIATVAAAGFVCGLLALVIAIGNGSVLAGGELSAHLSSFIVVAIFSAGIMPVATAFLSQIRGQVTTTQEISIVALTAVAGAAAAGFSGPTDSPALLATVLVAIGLSTALSGAAMFVLGRAGARADHPVRALSGVRRLSRHHRLVLGDGRGRHRRRRPCRPHRAAPAGGARALAQASARLRLRGVHAGVQRVAEIAAAAADGGDRRDRGLQPRGLGRRDLGWRADAGGLDRPGSPDGGSWPPVALADLARVQWGAVLAAMVYAPAVVLVTAAAATMNASAIELEIGADIDVNGELRSMGAGNLVSGVFGGVPGFPSVSTTLMAARLGAAEPMTGVFAGGVCLLGLVFASDLIALMPAPLLGGLLMWLGLPLLIEWLLRSGRRLHRGEYAIILMILAVSVVAGFAAGILTGIVAALGLFVVEYSRVGTARYIADARDYHGEIMPESLREVLTAHGASIVIVKLTGFIFFGTGDRLVQDITKRVAAAGPEPVRFVVMDFRRVTGIDSSAVMSFLRLRRAATRQRFVLVLSGFDASIRARLDAGGFATHGAGSVGAVVHVEPELEAALGWSASGLQAAVAPGSGSGPMAAPAVGTRGHAVARFLGDDRLAQAMHPHLDWVEFPAGTRFIEQGALSDDIYFIEEGEGIVQLEQRGAAPVKLAAFGSGTVLGEIAFYRGEPRSASAIARTRIVAARLSRAAIAGIEAEAPALAARLHQEMARALAGRLQSANRLIRVLAD